MQSIINFFLILIISIIFFSVTQTDKSLYLIYDESYERPWKTTSINEGNTTFSFIYPISYKGKVKRNLSFDEINETKRDTISFVQLKSINIKNYEWLKKDYLEFYHYFEGNVAVDSTGAVRWYNLEDRYNNIYIVRLDSTNSKAYLYKVTQGFIIVEDWDINLLSKDSINKIMKHKKEK